jgi:hypothetical protein
MSSEAGPSAVYPTDGRDKRKRAESPSHNLRSKKVYLPKYLVLETMLLTHNPIVQGYERPTEGVSRDRVTQGKISCCCSLFSHHSLKLHGDLWILRKSPYLITANFGEQRHRSPLSQVHRIILITHLMISATSGSSYVTPVMKQSSPYISDFGTNTTSGISLCPGLSSRPGLRHHTSRLSR